MLDSYCPRTVQVQVKLQLQRGAGGAARQARAASHTARALPSGASVLVWSNFPLEMTIAPKKTLPLTFWPLDQEGISAL